MLSNALHTAGTPVSGSRLTRRGTGIGDYAPAADSYLVTFIRMPKLAYVRCGVTPWSCNSPNERVTTTR